MMAKATFSAAGLLAAGVLGFGLGCFRAAPDPVYHTLRALAAEPGAAVSAAPGLAVEVLPVQVPDLLQRPQLVMALGPDQLELAAGHRWGNGLEQDMQRVLVVNLARLLGSDRVVPFPQGSRVAAAYRVEVEVHRCQGRPGGSLVFEATWTILDGSRFQALTRGQTRLELPVPDRGAAALVAAHNEALATLSRELAVGLRP